MKSHFAKLHMMLAVLCLSTACGDESSSAMDDDTNTEGVPSDSSAACPAVGEVQSLTLEPGMRPVEIDVEYNGVTTSRQFSVQVPQGFDAGSAYPVFFNFHGTARNANAWIDQLRAYHDQPVIAIAPAGWLRTDANTEDARYSWDTGKGETNQDDVLFMRKIWVSLKDSPGVNVNHVYATGESVGSAFIANRVAIDPCVDFLKGFANFSSVMFSDSSIPLSLSKRKALIVHGEADPIIPIDGGSMGEGTDIVYEFSSVNETLARWAAHNNCNDGAEVTREEGLYTKHAYEGCDAATVLYRLDGQGHGTNADWYAAGEGFESAKAKLVVDYLVNGVVP